ncbi:MAG: hypothetical protein O7C59_01925, partial [Rickettsia endosymbiont of Ixodes persulcatus]|nr:hypothetical protein [Rickettsia endosymbiont of Ixodes persulcatus]
MVFSAAQNKKNNSQTVNLTTFLTKPAPPPSNQIINMFKPSFFIIRKLPESNPFSGMTSEGIRKAVNSALTTLDAHTTDGTKVEVRGAVKMASGDIKFYTATRTMTSWLLINKHQWTHLSDPALITKPAVFPAILHSVPAHF